MTYDPQQMLVLKPNNHVTIHAKTDVHMMLLGGATMDGPRHIWWNFVASDKELLEQAKKDWKAGAFPTVPADSEEFIPLPEA
jgi:redox-sensitive bicupin YhaK (pirin superfamily)